MPSIRFTSPAVPFSDNVFNGGLNSTSGALGLQNNESSDLQNIDFNKFGSFLQRNGFRPLSNVALSGTTTSFGLHWYEYNNRGTTDRHAITVHNKKVFRMDDLDGTWNNVTSSVVIPDSYHDFTNFLNNVYLTSKDTGPYKINGTGNAALISTPTNLQWAKYNEEYNNFLFLANVKVAGTVHNSRFYWSTIKNTGSWTATNFIEVAKDDGQEITRIKKLGDRLVVYKTRSIYNVFFTGDADIPFILPGGGKSNSSVGCIAPFSIQEVNNGHVFLSTDGFYFYDGMNSFKISDKITTTLETFKDTEFINAPSLVQKQRNRYLCGFTISASSVNSKLAVWDYFNNAFSVYNAIEASTLATFYVDGTEERPHFGNYAGEFYRMDVQSLRNDLTINNTAAINAFYYTNWRSFGDLIDKKGVPQVTIYYQENDANLSFSYSYDLETVDQFTQSFVTISSTDVYGTALYGTATYAREGGNVKRRDLTSRGRVIRFKFGNNTKDETFQIDGLGSLVHLESLA